MAEILRPPTAVIAPVAPVAAAVAAPVAVVDAPVSAFVTAVAPVAATAVEEVVFPPPGAPERALIDGLIDIAFSLASLVAAVYEDVVVTAAAVAV